jgi:DNA-binding transcriptional ArsR family regulator
VAAGEATGSGFRARAGTLTLLYVAGSADREVLLRLLEGALAGGRLGPPESYLPAEDEPAFGEYEDDDAYEDEEDEEDDEFEDEDVEDELEEDEEEDYEDEEGVIALDPDLHIGPHTLLKTSPKGEHFLFVGFTLERWLRNRPAGPLRIGPSAGDTVAALVCCWSATVTHALAREPLTLPELNRAVELLDYETVEEHLEALERTGQVEPRPDGRQTRYTLTDWGREGIAPITAATRLERHYSEAGTAPPEAIDVEATFQLALPLLRLPAELSGSCRLGVQMPGGAPLMVGATVQVEKGRVASSSTQLDEEAENFVTGSPIDWLDTVVDPGARRLKTAGDADLAGGLLESLHETLFGVRVR